MNDSKKVRFAEYFSENDAQKLVDCLGVDSMGLLLSLASKPDNQIKDLVVSLGINEKTFDRAIEEASKVIVIPKRSGRVYPLGAFVQPPKSRKTFFGVLKQIWVFLETKYEGLLRRLEKARS